MTGAANDLLGDPPFVRTADDEHVVVGLLDDAAGEFAKMLDRPELGRSVGPARIQRDHAPVGSQPQRAPDAVGHLSLRLRHRQLQPPGLRRTTRSFGQREVVVDQGTGGHTASPSSWIHSSG